MPLHGSLVTVVHKAAQHLTLKHAGLIYSMKSQPFEVKSSHEAIIKIMKKIVIRTVLYHLRHFYGLKFDITGLTF